MKLRENNKKSATTPNLPTLTELIVRIIRTKMHRDLEIVLKLSLARVQRDRGARSEELCVEPGTAVHRSEEL